MMPPRSWLIGVLAISGCGSSSKPDLVRYASCVDCDPSYGRPTQLVATFSHVPVSTAWYSLCHHDAPNGQDGLVGVCELVDNDATFHCPDDRCRIGATTLEKPAPGELTGNASRTDVMIVKPGQAAMTVTLTPKRSGGKAHVVSVAITAAIPDRVEVACVADSEVVYVDLYANGQQLVGETRELDVRVAGGGRCERLDAIDALKNRYRCPLTTPTASLDVRNPDFSVTAPLTCPAVAAR